jgi:hypothetical protein
MNHHPPPHTLCGGGFCKKTPYATSFVNEDTVLGGSIMNNKEKCILILIMVALSPIAFNALSASVGSTIDKISEAIEK